MQKTKLLFTCIVSMLFYQNIFAQRCGTQQHQQMIEQQDPKSIIRKAEIEQFTADFAQHWDATAARAVITIPVVVHVVYNTGTQNVSDAQIQTQMDRLNLDYHKLNTDWTSTPGVWQSLVADVGIQFCLASRDPNGNSTTGITRTATSVTSFSTNDAVKYTSAGGHDAWPRSSYLNIWVCNLGGGLLGYAQTPGGPAATDGVVITYQGFGQSGTATYPYNKGRTATHEVGHWLNLEHIWGDDGGSCSGSDQVGDTPNQADAHGGCPSFPQVSCSNGPNGDMFMNYMDYVNDACMFMFSNGQSTRMNALFANGGFRASILNSQGCAGTSGTPVASFTGTPTSVCPGQTVQFTSTSTGTINTYAWTFTGGTPSTSSSQNPAITYNTPGTYSVSLTVTGPGGNNTSTQNAYISVANSTALPLAEGFENSTFPPTNWTITNGDGATTWARTTSASGFGTSSASAFVNCYNYQTTGQKDWLITPAYNFTGVTTGRIKWDYAYAQYQSTYTDSLTILYSTNCGSTWTTLWTRGGASLATANSTTNNFVPTSSQWKKDSVSLTTLNGQTNVKFAFVCTNDYGNNLFLDNVNIYAVTTGGAAPVANFVGNPTTVVVGNSVAFTDLSANSPTSWAWQFPGAATTTSTQQNPTITYNNIGTYDVTLTATNGNGSNAMTKTNYINVVAAGGSSCDTFSNWTTVALGDTPVLYLSGGWGYLAGHNDWGDLGKAEKFTNTTTMQITGGLYYFGHAHTNNPSTSIITARVWDATGAGGSPGTVLTSQTVLINNISTTGYTSIQFATPANVTSDYFVGFTFTYLAGDTVGLVTTTLNTPNANTGWELQGSNTWYPYTDGTNSWGVDLHNAIFPIGCTSTGSTPTASFTASPTGVCPGGTVNFTSTSTGNPTSYSWTFAGGNPSTSTSANPTVTYSATGTYNVILTATNANGSNTSTQNNYVTVYALPSLSTSSNAVACYGQSTGSATITATGSSPFNYSWSGGGASATISNKPAGSYTVTVTDIHQCSSTTSVNISQPLSALSGSASGIDASCSQQNGSVTANASGGAGNYTYHWNNNVNTQTASGLGAGTYSVTITDANSCTTTASATITNTTVTFVVNLNVTNTTCNQNNGAIAVTGSTTGNTYAWSNGGSTNFISNLAAGNYTVTVTHADGCSASASVAVVNAGSGISLTSSSTSSACAAATGSATVAVNGGTPNYTYIWNNGGNSATINNIGAGSYFVTVTDANSCSTTTVVTVSNTNAPNVSVNITPPMCSNSSDGSATATVTGGSFPYSFHWSSGSNNATAGSLAGGTYQLTVADAANCSAIESINVQAPSAVQVNIFVTNTTCGINNGTASVSVQGGMGNYIYQWSNSFFTSSISNLAAGQYTVTVTDGNGCSATQTSFVTSSSAMNVTITPQNPTTGSSNDGSATANPVAGTTPYNFSWSDGQTGPIATGLSPGTYTVTVTDAIGCTATASVTLVVTGIEELNAVEQVFVYPNPSAGNYQIQISNYKTNETITAEVFDVSGRRIAEQKIVSSVSSLNLSETSSGIYLLKIKSESGSRIIRLVKE